MHLELGMIFRGPQVGVEGKGGSQALGVSILWHYVAGTPLGWVERPVGVCKVF